MYSFKFFLGRVFNCFVSSLYMMGYVISVYNKSFVGDVVSVWIVK